MFIKDFLKKRRTSAAIKKTNLLMSTYTGRATVILSGTVKKYTDYFVWLEESHPDWDYKITECDGIMYVNIEKKKNDEGDVK